MVNKDMNGFPVKKCSAFQFFKKRVRRWIKSPVVSVDKHQSPSLKYTGPSVVYMPPGEPDFEPSLCQTCLGDQAFQRGVLPQEKESSSWETQSACEVSLLWIHSSERILGLCFSCIHAMVRPQNIFLMHIYKASEEDIELWPLLVHCTIFFK
uniref:Serum/glucocorticoid regulated kinase 1 n=1 Tax=Monodon monoceros TaxID=40151 RepID=A0A8C6AQI1_MONMO